MDKAHNKTDKLLDDLEKDLLKVYSKAYTEISKEIKKILDNPNFKEGVNNYALISKLKRFKTMQVNIAKEIENINKGAVKDIEVLLDNVTELNYEFAKDSITLKVDDLSWGVINPTTYKEVLKEQANPLFYLAVDSLSERTRIYTAIKKELALGLVQGESIADIAKRIQKVLNSNYKSAVRIARTETTRAENASRLEAFKHAESLGIKQKKIWVATADKRTRDSHRKLNGEEVDLDKPFSNGLMYPGDPTGDAKQVVNCRCAMITDIVKID